MVLHRVGTLLAGADAHEAADIGHPDLAVTDLAGGGGLRDHVDDRVHLTVVDDQVDAAVDAITSAAATGKIGDGKVWITSVERLVRIRTGEEGADAV